MTFHIITLFPQMFDSYLKESILARAIKSKKISVKFYNPRHFTEDKWRRIDKKPYGGGPGMVIEALPIIRAIEKAVKKSKGKNQNLRSKVKIIWLSPAGKQFSNNYARRAAEKHSDIIVVCGRYEGIDARVKKIFKPEGISVGPFVLTGGEIPAMTIIDAVSRQIPGVLGKFESLEEERVASSDVYTRPEVLEYGGRKYRVPKVLLSGHHARVASWRSKMAKK
ncbi:MAG: tRNA (guanosine(37)-N1)-methyltransferase TrmD [Candidatus Taylorbacteria bacterium]|nr:tRNA (guanosine(37)-N1)-methyltransferase TrmD [Candidatus Taylorbacteria bacterium]